MNETGFWDIAYRENGPTLLGVLRRYVPNVNIAQDLLHEVFITAINKYDSYTGKGSFEGWLHRIAVNTALMYLRNEKSKQIPAEALLSVIGDEEPDSGHSNDARTTIEAADFTDEELLTAIDRLPEHHKMVFNMYVMDDFSHKQIGTQLNISPGTSKSHLARARKKIQQYLYDDALSKKRIKVGKRAAALLLLPAKTHFIDALFRGRMSDFMIPPSGGTEFLSAALQQSAASAGATASQAAASTMSQMAASTASQTVATSVTQTITTATFWGSKLSYLALCCGTAAITSSVCWVSMSENSPLNQDHDTAPTTNSLMYQPAQANTDTTTFDTTNHEVITGENAIPVTEVLPVQDAENVGIQNKNESDSLVNNSGQPINDLCGLIPTLGYRQQDNQGDIKKSENRQQPNNTLSPTVPQAKNSNNQQPDNSKKMKSKTNKQVTGDSSEEPAEAIVVKKQVIQHQTVVVRDTIIIRE